MTNTHPLPVVAIVAACLLVEVPTHAQPIDALGIRAQGMAGTFVAFADDPTAVYWNPAGLATGPFFGISLDGSASERVPATLDPDAARRTGLMVAASMPALGFAYYRLEDRAVVAADALSPQDRNDPGSNRLRLRSLVTHAVGATLVQSLTEGLSIGATLKYVRGTAAEAVTPMADGSGVRERLDAARELGGQGGNAVDLDLGVLGVFGPVRAGLLVRHLSEPAFTSDEGVEFRLERQVRAGVAVHPSERFSAGIDVDLVDAPELSGRSRQEMAFGAEGSLWRGVVVRGGVRTSLVGLHGVVPALGASLGLGRRFWLDGQWTMGNAGRDAGWGLGCRLAY